MNPQTRTSGSGSGSPAGTGQPLIEVGDLWRIFRFGAIEVQALRGISTAIAAGEFVAIMGASGSGKSTFLNIVGCLDRPTRGTYRLGGMDVAKLTADERATIRNRDVGFVFQAFNLIPRLSALENAELPLAYADVALKEQRHRARNALAAVGLADRAAHFPSQLSGGEQQRVAIARALVTQPRLLLADEPTGNLDSETSLEIMNAVMQLNRERGITIVLVTHERELANFADRIVTFRDGEITADVRRSAPTPVPDAGPRKAEQAL